MPGLDPFLPPRSLWPSLALGPSHDLNLACLQWQQLGLCAPRNIKPGIRDRRSGILLTPALEASRKLSRESWKPGPWAESGRMRAHLLAQGGAALSSGGVILGGVSVPGRSFWVHSLPGPMLLRGEPPAPWAPGTCTVRGRGRQALKGKHAISDHEESEQGGCGRGWAPGWRGWAGRAQERGRT